MDDTYASMHARGGRTLIQVIRESLQRQLDSTKARIEQNIPFFPSPLGVPWNHHYSYIED